MNNFEERLKKLDGERYSRNIADHLITKFFDGFSKKEDKSFAKLGLIQLKASLDAIDSLCESELEKQVAWALLCGFIAGANYNCCIPVLFYTTDGNNLDEVEKSLFRYFSQVEILILPNYPLNDTRLRPDFTILYKTGRAKNHKTLLVECDSFMHHSAQFDLEKEKRRERIIEKTGYPMLRFAGGEIHRNPTKVAHEIMDFVLP